MNRNQEMYNLKVVIEARKRREKILMEHLKTGMTCSDLARKHGVSRQRMQIILARAKTDSVRT